MNSISALNENWIPLNVERRAFIIFRNGKRNVKEEFLLSSHSFIVISCSFLFLARESDVFNFELQKAKNCEEKRKKQEGVEGISGALQSQFSDSSYAKVPFPNLLILIISSKRLSEYSKPVLPFSKILYPSVNQTLFIVLSIKIRIRGHP